MTRLNGRVSDHPRSQLVDAHVRLMSLPMEVHAEYLLPLVKLALVHLLWGRHSDVLEGFGLSSGRREPESPQVSGQDFFATRL